LSTTTTTTTTNKVVGIISLHQTLTLASGDKGRRDIEERRLKQFKFQATNDCLSSSAPLRCNQPKQTSSKHVVVVVIVVVVQFEFRFFPRHR
jgi:hypothetical protein